MIHQLPIRVLDEHLIPYINDRTIPQLRESCDMFNELLYKRFSKIQSKKIQEMSFTHDIIEKSLRTRITNTTSVIERILQHNSNLENSINTMFDKINTLNHTIQIMDSVYQKYSVRPSLEIENPDKPYYMGTRNGPIENFKQWLIHEMKEDPSTWKRNGTVVPQSLRNQYGLSQTSRYDTTVPWFKYIDIHMNSPHAHHKVSWIEKHKIKKTVHESQHFLREIKDEYSSKTV